MTIKRRADAWTKEEDDKRLSTVLEHITNGDTQLNAFDMLSELFSRTPSAIGFRFNKVIRPDHLSEIETAKRNCIINERNKIPTRRIIQRSNPSVEIDPSGTIFKSLAEILHHYTILEEENKSLKEEIKTLKERS